MRRQEDYETNKNIVQPFVVRVNKGEIINRSSSKRAPEDCKGLIKSLLNLPKRRNKTNYTTHYHRIHSKRNAGMMTCKILYI